MVIIGMKTMRKKYLIGTVRLYSLSTPGGGECNMRRRAYCRLLESSTKETCLQAVGWLESKQVCALMIMMIV